MVDFFAELTTQQQSERNLRQTERYLRLLIESVREYAIMLLDPEGSVLTWSPGAERIEGYRAEEILGKHFAVFYHREDIRQGKPQKLLEEAVAQGRVVDEGWRLRKDGSRFWANVVITALRDEAGRLQGFGKVVRDETAKREAQEALLNLNEELDKRVQERTGQLAQAYRDLRISFEQLRALASRLQEVREEERTSIAREIHDELGQALTALKMDVVWLMQRLPEGSKPWLAKTDSMLKLIDNTISAVRRIAAELRPGMLDDLGLVAAIEWQAQEFQGRTGVECQVLLPTDDVALDEEHSTAVFRIFQETLTNIARHANATRVSVKLERTAQEIVLEVQDNGKGLEEAAVFSTRSLGLLGMKERALLLGGGLEVHGSQGKGTTVTLRIPWNARAVRDEQLGTPKRRRSDGSNSQGPTTREGRVKS